MRPVLLPANATDTTCKMDWNKDLTNAMSFFGFSQIDGPENSQLSNSDIEPQCSRNTSFSYEPEISKNDLDVGSEITIDSNNNTPVRGKTYKCCGKTYAHYSSYRRHKVINHTEDGHECSQCNKLFYSKSDLTAHRLTHDEIKHFKCGYRKKEYATRGGLNSHIKEHRGDFKYMCDLCGKEFIYKNSFDGHKAKYDNDKPFKCETCGKFYTYRSSLSRHVCGDSRNNIVFSCNLCGKKFKAKRYLKDHLSAHSNQERFQCSTRGNFFKYRPSFFKHKKKTGYV